MSPQRPPDLMPRKEIADHIGYSERTVRQWVKDHPDELSTWEGEQHNNSSAQVLVSLSAVVSFCERHGKEVKTAASLHGGGAPSSTMEAPLVDGGASGVELALVDGGVSTVEAPLVDGGASRVAASSPVPDPVEVLLRAELAAVQATAQQASSEVAGLRGELVVSKMEAAVLREAVSRLEAQLLDEKARRIEEQKRSDARAFDLQARMDSQLVALQASHDEAMQRMDAQLTALKTTHDESAQRLVGELDARRQEAAEMREAVERQQQREAMLRWKTATTERERDFALAALKDISGAGFWQRLTWRAPKLELETSAPGPETSAVVDVDSEQ